MAIKMKPYVRQIVTGEAESHSVTIIKSRGLIVVSDEPVERGEPCFHGESRILLREITRRPYQRSRIARRGQCQPNRLVVQPRALCRREPLTLFTGRARDQAGQDLARRLRRVLPGHGAKPGQVGAGTIRGEAVPPVRLVHQPGVEQHLLAERVDILVAGPGAATAFGRADRIGLLAHCSQCPDGPALVRPKGLNGQDVHDLGMPPGEEQGAETGRRSVEMTAEVLVRAECHPRDAHEAIRPD